MREGGANPGLAIRDRARLGSEARIRVELLELVRVAQRPVLFERVLPGDVHGPGDVTAARGAFFGAREFSITPHVEQPRVAGANGGEDLLLRCDHTGAQTGREYRRLVGSARAGLERSALGDPFLDAALHDGHAVVAETAEREPQTRGVMAALGVVPHHHRVVADAEPGHCARELLGALEHPSRVSRFGRRG